MKYSIDRIENNIAVLENIENKEKKEIDITLLPKGYREGSIVILRNDKYELNLDEEEIRRKRMMDKFKRLKK